MRLKHLFVGSVMTVVAVVLAFAGWQPAQAQSGEPSVLSGWFAILWRDGRAGSSVPAPLYTLTDDSGQRTSLLMDESLAARLGGVLSLDRRRVTVSGTLLRSAAAQGNVATLRVASIAPDDPQSKAGAGGAGAAVSGAQPFISILCMFNNIGAKPKPLDYFNGMYGSTYPGLDDYWRQSSYNMINIVGSAAVGWYRLPHPRSYYVYNGALDFVRAADDCTGAADATVNFAPFKGINLMFNSDLDGYAWGGGLFMTLDGVTKFWPMTWEPPWGYSDITVIAHEMGHAFGLPHSSGQYGQTYDNQWDVMSDVWTNCSRSSDPTYGCLGQDTISFHKDLLGWIPAAQKFTLAWHSQATITLEQLTLPQTGGYLMAKVPIQGSSTHFYTIEARRRTGYDVKLPGQGVIIHEVDLMRGIPANVIDDDGNGNTGDDGAMWTVGETFVDATNGIFVNVVSATASGFQVSIQTPAVLLSTAANDGWVLESAENSSVGGTLNSAAGTLKLGDDAANRQFRGILSFDTSSLPHTAVVTRATLRIRSQALVGTNPFSTLGALRAEIRAPFFGRSLALEPGDFQAATGNTAAVFGATPSAGWYSAVFTGPAAALVNWAGTIQFRLHFTLDDNNNHSADTLMIYSGEASAANRPKLVIQYYVP